DAGDWWQGTPEGSLTKGAAVAEVFNAIGYDAVEVGNHEFDNGTASLKDLIGKLRMPVLAANIYGPDGRHVPWTKQRIIKKVDGVRFGIFGLLTTHMNGLEVPGKIAGLTFRREVDEARDQVRALKKEGADVIIAVTHVGFESPDKPPFEGDQTIAREVPGIDLIVGGHTHTTLKVPWRDPAHGTLIVQTGSYLTKAGRATLTIDPATHRVIRSSDELIELWPDRVGEDPAVKAIVDRAEARTGAAFELVVATASAELDRGAGAEESGLGSWMADCFKEETGADAALLNGGGIRADIAAGPVTVRELFDVMPFDDAVVVVRMKGSLLRSTLDHVIGSPKIAQIAGMTARFRPLKPRHQRLDAVTVDGAPLDDEKTYSLATLDFIAGSYPEFKSALSVKPTGTLARDEMRACAAKQKTVSPPAPGRLTNLGD
ncbi:MAG TPA: bifunctional UDP-sugar hydrolase/5'-nucleotidase, partial [Elusimicrobiota bacterium]|nr:bifunctional UDP-sugar hydrolase/5'-nucleotidase [Elusimicrobiota bacterium]